MDNESAHLLGLRWYVKLNDLIGGWSIGTEPGPASESGVDYDGVLRGGHMVADFIPTWELAQHLVVQHNKFLGLDDPSNRSSVREIPRD